MWVSPEAYRIIGECLATARKSANVSQDELAARLRKAQSFISAYERGQRRVDLAEFLVILEALKVDPREAFATIVERLRGIVRKGGRQGSKKSLARSG